MPTAPPQNVAIQSATATQLDVTWDPPPVDAQNGDIQGYKVRFSLFLKSPANTAKCYSGPRSILWAYFSRQYCWLLFITLYKHLNVLWFTRDHIYLMLITIKCTFLHLQLREFSRGAYNERFRMLLKKTFTGNKMKLHVSLKGVLNGTEFYRRTVVPPQHL